jgi:hypothetical protein
VDTDYAIFPASKSAPSKSSSLTFPTDEEEEEHSQSSEQRRTKKRDSLTQGMDLWNRARSLAEETAKRTQDLSIGASKFSDLVSETAKRSKEIAAEASKRAEQIKSEAFKHLAEQISPSTSTDSPLEKDLEKFGVTDELRDFVKEIHITTFQDFPLQGKQKQNQSNFSARNIFYSPYLIVLQMIHKCPISLLSQTLGRILQSGNKNTPILFFQLSR